MRIPKDLQQLHTLALAQGWRVELSGKGHLCWYPPDGGAPVRAAFTTNDPREKKNVTAKFRRAGLKIERG